MADIKVLKINTAAGNGLGLDIEHSEAADSIKMLSFKTANYELTDTKLGKLVDGADAADEHIHDARYFRENEHIDASTGAPDAGKPIKTDGAGLIDSSFIDKDELEPLLDHDSLNGVAASTAHTAFPLLDGTRPFTGNQSMGSNRITNLADPVNDQDAATKAYVYSLHIGDEWYPYSAKDYIVDNTLAPPTEVDGDVYILSHDGGAPNAAYDGAAAGDIVKFNGTSGLWEATTPTTGTKISVDDETNSVRLWSGSQWDQKFYEATTASTGLTKVGVDIQIDSSAAGDGLGFAAGVLSANVDNASIEINADTLRVKADGINDTHIDWGSGANQVDAFDVPHPDAGGRFPTDNMGDIVEFLYDNIQEVGDEMEVDTGGVSKGDLLYASSANKVLDYSNLSVAQRALGVAGSTEAAAANVSVVEVGIVTGILTAATVGAPQFWNGTGWQETIPTGVGQNIYEGGVAVNATDMKVNVRPVKINS